MSSKRRRRKNNAAAPAAPAGAGARAALYVDELADKPQRTLELNGTLRYSLSQEPRFTELLVYGSPASDADEQTRDLIAQHQEHDTKVTFTQKEPPGPGK